MTRALAITTISALLALAGGVFQPVLADTNWVTINQDDPLTDQKKLDAYKKYQLDGTANIEALAECSPSAITFKFVLHADPLYYGEGFEHTKDSLTAAISGGMMPSRLVHLHYRLDNGKVYSYADSSRYINEIHLDFQGKTKEEQAAEDPLFQSPSVDDLKTAKLLRVQFPIDGGRRETLQIYMNELKSWLATCPKPSATENKEP